jgi:hypothetical protein
MKRSVALVLNELYRPSDLRFFAKCQLLRIGRVVWLAQRIPTAVNLYFSIQVAPQLYSRG